MTHRSCKEILAANPNSLSGLYQIKTSAGPLQVYCDMSLGGGGWTFLPRSAITTNSKLGTNLDGIFTNKTQVLLRFQKRDGTQPFTLVQQLPQFSKIPISVMMNSYSGFHSPLNTRTGPYLYLVFLPNAVTSSTKKPGFLSNGKSILYTNCGQGQANFFAFFPNHDEKPPHPYHKNNLVYERVGVAVDWRKSGQRTHSFRQMPNDFFYLTEMHFSGCGCYTSSDRWTDALGTAIGLK